MAFFYELETDACGNPIRNAVNFAFLHLVVHGIFVTAFVFTNTSYPLFYYVDYMFGISGAILIIVALVGLVLANLPYCQPLRAFWALIVLLNILTITTTALYYTTERWNDVITTAFTRALRKPVMRDFPDQFWRALAVIACLICLAFLVYFIYISSYMCNRWKSHLFTCDYGDYTQAYTIYPTSINIPSVPHSNAYPTQDH